MKLIIKKKWGVLPTLYLETTRGGKILSSEIKIRLKDEHRAPNSFEIKTLSDCIYKQIQCAVPKGEVITAVTEWVGLQRFRKRPLMCWQRFYCEKLIVELKEVAQQIHDFACEIGAYCDHSDCC